MLSSKHRFHRRNHVNRVYKDGKSIRLGGMSLKYRTNPKLENFRFAVAVSKKVSKSAVVRNRIRRRIFEAIRVQGAGIDPGLEGVIGVFDEKVAVMPSAELQKQVSHLLAKAK